MKRLCFLLGFSVLVLLLFFDYQNFHNPGEPFFNNLATSAASTDIRSYEFTPEQLTLKFNARKDPFFSFPFPTKLSFWKRLRVDFSRLSGVKSITVFYQLAGDSGFPQDQMLRKRITGRNTYSYDFLLPPGNYTHLRIDFDGYKPDATAIVKDLRLLDFSAFFYTQAYFYLLATAILVLLILPGSLLYALFADQNRIDSETNLLMFFGLSIMFYLVLYGIMEAAHGLGINSHISVGLAFLLLFAGLCGMIVSANRQDIVWRMFFSEKRAFLSALILTLAACILLTGFVRAPFSFDSINWDTIDGEVIFSHFTGHDNMFQYVNGMAIANNEPFSKYYADNRLMFGVQDREMLAGVIYSVFRTLISAISPSIGESYLTYTLVGLCMNIMVIFPLTVLMRRYFRPCNEYLFILVLSLNTFVLANYYFTWFKFAGAALFISGMLLLLRDRQNALSWLLAGIAFGLSTNMHAGNALGIPLIFLWIVYLNLRQDGFLAKTVLVYPVLLALIFAVVNVPWAVVKSLYYPDQHALFRSHYLPGSSGHEGIWENIGHFFQSHPVQEQLIYRLTNLFDSLRFSEFSSFFAHFAKSNTYELLYFWCNSEFKYFSIAIYPILLIAAVSKAVSLVQARSNSVGGQNRISDPLRHESATLITLAFCTVAGLILLSYHDYPDANHHLPMGIVLIVHALLIGFSLKSGKIGTVLLLAYGCLAFWRIGSLFLHFL